MMSDNFYQKLSIVLNSTLIIFLYLYNQVSGTGKYAVRAYLKVVRAPWAHNVLKLKFSNVDQKNLINL